MPQPNAHRSGNRIARSVRGQAVHAESAATIEYMSGSVARRAQVYRTDVEFAPEHAGNRARKPCDTPEMRERIAKLRATGMSYLDVANAVDVSIDTVRKICVKYGITKG